ncbi:hypothetical protein ACOSP7_014326 [Xanthoceras sorbifolium]
MRVDELIGSLQTFELNLKPINKHKGIDLKSTAHESKIAEESNDAEDLAMIVSEIKKVLKGKKSNSGFNCVNAKKDEKNCFTGVASYQEAERYNSSDESEDEFEDKSKEESMNYNDLADAFEKLYKMNIKVQKSNSSLLTIVKYLEGERDDAIKGLKETNMKQDKKIAYCMERMKLMKLEIEQKDKSLEISRMCEKEVTKELTVAKESIKGLTLGAKKIDEMISLGKMYNDKRGLGLINDSKASTSKTVFFKATSTE